MSDESNRKTAFVTGATGFVGGNLARLLLERGYRVRLLVRKGADRRNIPAGADAEIHEGDLKNAENLREGVRGCDEIFHVAADYRFWAPDPREIYENNVVGTKRLLEACEKEGVRKFVHTSTVGTIGLAEQPRPCDERTPCDPGQFTSHYKRSKFEAEHLVRQMARTGFPAVIVNPSTPIGPMDRKPTPTGQMIVDFVNGRLPAYVETGLNFVHVRDVCEGHLAAAAKGRIGERYILGDRNLRIVDFLGLVAARLPGRQAPRIRLPYGVAWTVGWLNTAYSSLVSKKAPRVALEAVRMSKRFMFFDSSKAVRELGWRPTSVETAVSDALEWFSQNGYFPPSEVTYGRAFKTNSRDRFLHHEAEAEGR